MERSSRNRAIDHPEPSSCRLRRSICKFPCHQGSQGCDASYRHFLHRLTPPPAPIEPPRDRKKQKNIKHNGNIPLEEIFQIARTMKAKSLAKELSGCVKEILGTCRSVACTVDGKTPQDVIDGINDGSVEVPDE